MKCTKVSIDCQGFLKVEIKYEIFSGSSFAKHK